MTTSLAHAEIEMMNSRSSPPISKIPPRYIGSGASSASKPPDASRYSPDGLKPMSTAETWKPTAKVRPSDWSTGSVGRVFPSPYTPR